VLRQLQFLELVETAETRDRPFVDRDGAWGTRIVRPNGHGWRVLDAHREHFTLWIRRRLVVRNPSRREWRR
jgi:hypothetical protein